MTELMLSAMLMTTLFAVRRTLLETDPKSRMRALRVLGPAAADARRVSYLGAFGSALSSLSSGAVGERGPKPRWMLAAAGGLLGLTSGAAAAFVSPALAYAGFKAPDLLRSIRVRARRSEISAALSDAVDMLAVCTRAGLNVALALGRVASRTPGPLGDELRRVLDEIALGVPRAEALASMARRSGIDDLDALVATLNNSERFGTQIASSLELFAQEIRSKRRRIAEEQGRRAPVKILFPLVFLILPAFILLTVAPLLLGTFRSLGF